MSLSKFLQEDMKNRLMNKSQYSQFLGVYPTELARALNSEKLPSKNVQVKIASALGVSIDELIFLAYSGDRAPAPTLAQIPITTAEAPTGTLKSGTWAELFHLSSIINETNPNQKILTKHEFVNEYLKLDEELRERPRDHKKIAPILLNHIWAPRLLYMINNDKIEIVGRINVLLFEKESISSKKLESLSIETLPPQTLPGVYDALLEMGLLPEHRTPKNEQFLIATAEETLSIYTQSNIYFDSIYAEAQSNIIPSLLYLGFQKTEEISNLYHFFVIFPFDREFRFPSIQKRLEEINSLSH